MRRLAHRAAAGQWLRNTSATEQTVAARQPVPAAVEHGQGRASQCTVEPHTASWPDPRLCQGAGSHVVRRPHVAANASAGRDRALVSDESWPSGQHLQSTAQHYVHRLHSSAATAASAATAQHQVPGSGNDAAVSLAFPTFMVWGANTDVGKTLVSAGLAAAAIRAKVCLAVACWRQSRICRICLDDCRACSCAPVASTSCGTMPGTHTQIQLLSTPVSDAAECVGADAAALSEARADRLSRRLGRSAGGVLSCQPACFLLFAATPQVVSFCGCAQTLLGR
jgi:hypothetical protein